MFYIFVIAVLNLGLGFAAAVYLGRCHERLAAAASAPGISVKPPDQPPENEGNEAVGDEVVGESGDDPQSDDPPTSTEEEFDADLDAILA